MVRDMNREASSNRHILSAHQSALTAGFAAVKQTPIKRDYEALRGSLLTLTSQADRTTHPAIRATAHADRTPRGWTEKDVFKLRDLLAYAAATSQAPMVLVTKKLDPNVPTIVLDGHEALGEAVREIADHLTARAAESAAEARKAEDERRWWITEHADLLTSH